MLLSHLFCLYPDTTLDCELANIYWGVTEWHVMTRCKWSFTGREDVSGEMLLVSTGDLPCSETEKIV